jgi:hypothetical protein
MEHSAKSFGKGVTKKKEKPGIDILNARLLETPPPFRPPLIQKSATSNQ